MRQEAGSVLVEAMVAVAVLAVVLVVASRAVGDGARRVSAVDRTELALLEAQSRLDEVGGDIALAPGASSGEDGGFDWRVEIEPAQGPATANGRLMDVRVEVSREGRPAFSLHSMRLAPGELPAGASASP